jgi:hypothetical protein
MTIRQLTFRQHNISPTLQFANITIRPHGIYPTLLFAKHDQLTIHQHDILQTRHFAIMTFHELANWQLSNRSNMPA